VSEILDGRRGPKTLPVHGPLLVTARFAGPLDSIGEPVGILTDRYTHPELDTRFTQTLGPMWSRETCASPFTEQGETFSPSYLGRPWWAIFLNLTKHYLGRST
jgi:hypothetical protein